MPKKKMTQSEKDLARHANIKKNMTPADRARVARKIAAQKKAAMTPSERGLARHANIKKNMTPADRARVARKIAAQKKKKEPTAAEIYARKKK